MNTTARAVLSAFDALPFGTLADIVGPGRPLILAPHADDESLGCGGLVAACCARGSPPAILVVTDGTGSHPNSRTHPPEILRTVREQEARTAVGLLGVPPGMVSFLGLKDTAAPLHGAQFESAVVEIALHVRASQCRTILAPWHHDPHCDHEATHAMARRVARLTGLPHLSYPVWGWTLAPSTPLPVEPIQGWRFDIGPDLDVKRRAIAAHQSQYGDLITDDPDGFRLPPNLLAVFDRPYEVFIRA